MNVIYQNHTTGIVSTTSQLAEDFDYKVLISNYLTTLQFVLPNLFFIVHTGQMSKQLLTISVIFTIVSISQYQ
ncbi:hypothetical protein PHET_02254 [Paragonimus heterotremus]|uniref:Uncharacterized protein n=1 Tax=Paragonimus heterotremus TaxID=100268 RepID=A0A8J4TKE6_9TREM|nr:hypothetical protein PHET_02254 [Paragonimus heterotremus]